VRRIGELCLRQQLVGSLIPLFLERGLDQFQRRTGSPTCLPLPLGFLARRDLLSLAFRRLSCRNGGIDSALPLT